MWLGRGFTKESGTPGAGLPRDLRGFRVRVVDFSQDVAVFIREFPKNRAYLILGSL